MVLKKPYAFLIKNFKIIHIILSVLIISILVMFGSINSFFLEYVRGNVLETLGLATTYINPLIYLNIFIVITFSLFMFLLMKNKEKPTTFYIMLFIYYILLLIMVFIALRVMNSIAESSLTQQSSRAYRDIFLIISAPQYYFLIISIIRGIGFDVKKFNFNKDLEELEIKSEDNEEFEFVLGTNTYKYKRKLRRSIREFKYYILENKLIFTIISSVVIIGISIFMITNTTVINRIYKVGNTANIGSLQYTLLSAYETKYDYNGNEISKGKKYIILEIIIDNKTNRAQTLNNTSIYLKAENESIYNMPTLRDYFIDFGKTYTNNPIPENSNNKYILVFEIDDDKNINNYYLNILNNINIEDGITEYNYTKFKIKTEKIDKKLALVERKINEIMYLGDNIFDQSNVVFKSAEIKNNYEYKYESCLEDKCSEYYNVVAPDNPANDSLIILNYKLDINTEIGLKETITNNELFFDKFLKIEYKYNKKNVVRNINAKTYPDLDNIVFIEVPKSALKSDLLNIVISTRNNRYYLDLTSI